MLRIIDPIGRYARSVRIERPVPCEGFEFRKIGTGADERRSTSGMIRINTCASRFAFFAMVVILTACVHGPTVNPGETIRDDDGQAAAEPRSVDTCDRSIARAEPDGAPIFVQH